jgi:hypothetical protein
MPRTGGHGEHTRSPTVRPTTWTFATNARSSPELPSQSWVVVVVGAGAGVVVVVVVGAGVRVRVEV